MLLLATDLEKRAGAASMDYIEPSRGDLKYKAAGRLIELMKGTVGVESTLGKSWAWYVPTGATGRACRQFTVSLF